MSHRHKGSRAARRQADPNFMEVMGGNSGSQGPKDGKSKIPVKDHKGKGKGQKGKGGKGGGPKPLGVPSRFTPLDNDEDSPTKEVEDPPFFQVNGGASAGTRQWLDSIGKDKENDDNNDTLEKQTNDQPIVDKNNDEEKTNGENTNNESKQVEQYKEDAAGGTKDEQLTGDNNEVKEKNINESKPIDQFKDDAAGTTEDHINIEINYMEQQPSLDTIQEMKEAWQDIDGKACVAGSTKEGTYEDEEDGGEVDFERLMKECEAYVGGGSEEEPNEGNAKESTQFSKSKIPSLLKQPKPPRSGGKGLRVTFDLSNTPVKDEVVMDSWEDLSDGAEFEIEAEDLIDCTSGKMDDLLGQLGKTDVLGVDDEEGGQWFRPSEVYKGIPLAEDEIKPSEGGDKEDLEKQVPVLGADQIPLNISLYQESNNVIPFIDGEEDGEQVPEGWKEEVPEGWEEESPEGWKEEVPEGWEEEVPEGWEEESPEKSKVEIPREQERKLSLGGKEELPVIMEEKVSEGETDHSFEESHVEIKEEEEEVVEDDDDDEWETEPSGTGSGSSENNDMKAILNKFVENVKEEIGKKREDEEEDKTLVDQPSLEEFEGGEEEDLVTKEDIDAVFMTLEKKPDSQPMFTPEFKPSLLNTWGDDFFQVSIGHETRQEKPAASETESEGELVPCEDKCVGTADTSSCDEEPIDLSTSVSDVTSSAYETVSSISKETNKDTNINITDNQVSNITVLPPEASSNIDSSTPSPLPEGCIGKSESEKEKESNGKKFKKKGKKNKLIKEPVILEPQPLPEHILGRPKLVRGRTWKERREKFNKDQGETHVDKVLDEALEVDKSSSDAPPTPPSDSLPAPFIPAPDIPTSSVPSEGEQSDDKWLASIIVPPPPNIAFELPTPPKVTLEVPSEDESEEQQYIDAKEASKENNYFVVTSSGVIVPLEAEKEYVGDSESSEDAAASVSECKEIDNIMTLTSGSAIIVGKTNIASDSPIDSSDNSAYIDAKDSTCTESIPSVNTGTHSFTPHGLIYQYDSDSDFDSTTDIQKTLEGTSVVAGAKEDTAEEREKDEDDGFEVPAGEIVYEGPCKCGIEGGTEVGNVETDGGLLECIKAGAGVALGTGYTDQSLLCGLPSQQPSNIMPDENMKLAVDSTNNDVKSEEDKGKEVEEEFAETDIRSRIKEIVGPRLRGKGKPDDGDEDASPLRLRVEEDSRTRDESPLPASSAASSSGVQASDEMSLSPSRSRSPSGSKDDLHVLKPAEYIIEGELDQAALLEKLGLDPLDPSSSEKLQRVDYSFEALRDMYHINPAYLTDESEDLHDSDDLNESDTIHGSAGYDQDHSTITVNSLGSTSEGSPVPRDPSESPPPLAPTLQGPRGTRKVPKVTKLLKETQGIVQRWEVLQAQAVERQRQSGQVRELQRQVKVLRLQLEGVAGRASDHAHDDDVSTHDQIKKKLADLKELEGELCGLKSEVSAVNLGVHRFLGETGYSLGPLKDEVAELYRLWDEASNRVSSETSRLEGLEATWRLWEVQAEELQKALRQDHETLKVLDAAIQTGSVTDSVTASMQDVAKLLNDRRKGKRLTLQHTRTQGVDISSSLGVDELSDSGTSGYESCSSEELSERERRLAHLRKLARDLEASLHPDSEAWAAITKTLSSAEDELKGLQQHCRELVVRSADTLDHAKPQQPPRRRSWGKEGLKAPRSSRGERRVAPLPPRAASPGVRGGRRGWVWRVVRASLPFQAALLLLFCVACLLEPDCCDHVNTLNLSLSPQLRYVHGPPPV